MFGLFDKKPPGLGMFGGQPETYEAMGGNGPQAASAMGAGGQGGFQMRNPQIAMMGLGMLSGRNNQEAFGGALKGAMAAHEMAQPKGGSMWTEKMKNFAFAKQQGFEGTFQDWMRQEGTDSELGLIPQYGRDKDGNPILIQIGKDGQAVQTKLPEGVTLDPAWVKQMQAQGSAVGKATGEAQIALPGAEIQTNETLGVINKALEHPGRETFTGASGTWHPSNYLAGTEAQDYRALHDQIKGKSFLTAFESLKGAGQITEQEGQKATEAIARLNSAQSDSAYKEALEDLKIVVENGLKRAQMRAGAAPTGTGREDPLGIRN
jgi:hypothetical protein